MADTAASVLKTATPLSEAPPSVAQVPAAAVSDKTAAAESPVIAAAARDPSTAASQISSEVTQQQLAETASSLIGAEYREYWN